jgi:hypothetical protein
MVIVNSVKKKRFKRLIQLLGKVGLVELRNTSNLVINEEKTSTNGKKGELQSGT